jgi:hypothetical protein
MPTGAPASTRMPVWRGGRCCRTSGHYQQGPQRPPSRRVRSHGRRAAPRRHLIVPKVESATRALLLELNEPLYRAAVGDGTGQFPGLGSLLPTLMENEFDEDWERFLRCFLLNEGSNVQNLTAHGFANGVSPVEAALAIRAGALMILLTNQNAVSRDEATVRAALSTPHGSHPSRSWRRRLIAAFAAARREVRY